MSSLPAKTPKGWGHEPKVVHTTRLKIIGVGQHKRKNDALDAEHTAIAVDQGRIPEAQVLSPERREPRKKLSVRQALVQLSELGGAQYSPEPALHAKVASQPHRLHRRSLALLGAMATYDLAAP